MTRAEARDGFVRIVERDHHEDFHARWLWHASELGAEPPPGELGLHDVAVDDGVLRVTWAHDRRVSRFPLAWLHEQAYAIDRVAAPRPIGDPAAIEVDGSRGPDAAAVAVLERLALHGVVLVRREHASPERETEVWLAALEARGLRVVPTRAGRIQELRADAAPPADSFGLDRRPRYRLLHEIHAADRSDEVVLVDGEAALHYLASLDAIAADLLVKTPVRFHRRRTHDHDAVAPIVSIRDGRVQVRSPYVAAAPERVPFERVAAWFRAHDQLVEILRDPRHHVRFAIRSGDLVIYDHGRILYGRAGSPRWIRSAYFHDPTDLAADEDASG